VLFQAFGLEGFLMQSSAKFRSRGTIIVLSLALSAIAPTAKAATLTGAIDLTAGTYSGNLWNAPDVASFIRTPVDAFQVDGYYETVVKLNFAPAPDTLFKLAAFDVFYDASPQGMSVNIGDSISNNGHNGDAGTQSNDAEMQIGANPNDFASDAFDDLRVFGNDYVEGKLLHAPDLVGPGTKLSLTVSDNHLGWNNSAGTSGSLESPYLYALNGQPDFEGEENYDIFAAFNRSIGSANRWGSGVSRVEIKLSTPEPSTTLSLLALGSFGIASLVKRHSETT
jgi:hypothetical protein